MDSLYFCVYRRYFRKCFSPVLSSKIDRAFKRFNSMYKATIEIRPDDCFHLGRRRLRCCSAHGMDCATSRIKMCTACEGEREAISHHSVHVSGKK